MGLMRRVALLGLAGWIAGCGGHDEGGGAPPKLEPVPEGMVRFDPALLDFSPERKALILTLPPMRVQLGDDRPYEAVVQVAVECYDQGTFNFLENEVDALKDPVELAFATRGREEAASTTGRLRIRDEIVQRMRQSLERRGLEPAIREIYFLQYHIRRSRG